jgi:small subunit ribosomal protein S17
MANKKQEEEIEGTVTEAAETAAEGTTEETPTETAAETQSAETQAAETQAPDAVDTVDTAPAAADTETAPEKETAGGETPVRKGDRGNRAQKVGMVSSDKMQKTCVVRVDRLVKHPKYRRYVRRRTKFMAHNEMGATTGDRVRIVETRPLSAHKRWRVVEIIQKAEK